jgi:HD-GYP domain-containing protein (c-di-GMP phosphodiesterase class II)
MQHHEQWRGKGFPQGLSKEKIHPLARIVAAADVFCKLALPPPGEVHPPVQDILWAMKRDHALELEPRSLAAIHGVFEKEKPA